MQDQQAAQLAELEVKRDRTLADLEAVQAAGQSVTRSLRAFREKQAGINETYISQLETDGIPEADRLETYRQWDNAIRESGHELDRLNAERERLHMQELILVRMLTELDHQIGALKARMAS